MEVDYSQLDVIVLTYNRAKTLTVMLESLCTQTAQGFHITVLNNASTDNTLEIVKKLQCEYPNRDIKVITNKRNLGNIGNFKESQKIAKNTYTAVFHDDDAIHPEYIETAMKLLSENEDAVLCTGNVYPYYNVNNYNWSFLNKNYYLYPEDMGPYLQLHVTRHVFQTAIYKTEVYRRNCFQPEKYGKLHDITFLMEVSRCGPSILILGECARMGVSPSQDSCQLSSGPFPNEISSIIKRINKLTLDEAYAKPALWNFSYFLYSWAELSRFETWKEFLERLKNEVFTNKEIKTYSHKANMDSINEEMAAHAQNMCNGENIFQQFDSSTRMGLRLT